MKKRVYDADRFIPQRDSHGSAMNRYALMTQPKPTNTDKDSEKRRIMLQEQLLGVHSSHSNASSSPSSSISKRDSSDVSVLSLRVEKSVYKNNNTARNKSKGNIFSSIPVVNKGPGGSAKPKQRSAVRRSRQLRGSALASLSFSQLNTSSSSSSSSSSSFGNDDNNASTQSPANKIRRVLSFQPNNHSVSPESEPFTMDEPVTVSLPTTRPLGSTTRTSGSKKEKTASQTWFLNTGMR